MNDHENILKHQSNPGCSNKLFSYKKGVHKKMCTSCKCLLLLNVSLRKVASKNWKKLIKACKFIWSDTETLNIFGPQIWLYRQNVQTNKKVQTKKINNCIVSFYFPLKTIYELFMLTSEGLTPDKYNTNYQFFRRFWIQIVTANI